MAMSEKLVAAIIGSGNIGTDLLIKILRTSEKMTVGMMVGIDAQSEGLTRASRLGVETTSLGVKGLIASPGFPKTGVVFDATSAHAHEGNWRELEPLGVRMVDLTPAAIGPYVIPSVNLDTVVDQRNLNMVTCGGQATVPIVAAVGSVTPVLYAEIVASISSSSAGPGTRANIDEFTETTSRAIELLGGPHRGKATIILNPADPPLVMRDTVSCLTENLSPEQRIEVEAAVTRMVDRVTEYVPGYRLKQRVQFRDLPVGSALRSLIPGSAASNVTQTTVFLEVEVAGHYLPPYAGNLDIMTSAAVRVGDAVASRAIARAAA